jgi:hypothetical protein
MRYRRRARDVGAQVLAPIADREYGLRDFTILDPDGWFAVCVATERSPMTVLADIDLYRRGAETLVASWEAYAHGAYCRLMKKILRQAQDERSRSW